MIVPRNEVLQGHILERLKQLPNDCIDTVVTSPPYWGLRDYGEECVTVWDSKEDCEHEWQAEIIFEKCGKATQSKGIFIGRDLTGIQTQKTLHQGNFCSKCGAWKGQLGLEPHPLEYINHLAQVFLEIKRVLKPSGSLWLNLGDTYFGGNGKAGRPLEWQDLELSKIEGHAHAPTEFIKERNKFRSNWLQPKQKMLIPERVAIALQEQGWILRNTVVWHKVNHMPESCRDRLTRSWESVFFFVKSERYFFDLDAIRKHYPLVTVERCKRAFKSNAKTYAENFNTDKHKVWAEKVVGNNNPHKMREAPEGHAIADPDRPMDLSHPNGANPGDVWSLTTEGLKEQHFAAYPQKLVKRILSASCPKQICNECSRPKTRLTKISYNVDQNGLKANAPKMQTFNGDPAMARAKYAHATMKVDTVGWSTCQCDKGFHAGLVLDPFAGAGTTLLVAHKMGFDWLGIELVPKYCDIINKRIERHGKVRLDGFLKENITL